MPVRFFTKYPAQDDTRFANLDFIEGYGGQSYTFEQRFEPTLAAYVYYSPDFSGETGDALYFNPTFELSLPMDFTFIIGYGFQDADEIGDYQHYAIELAKDISIFNLNLTFHDTFDDEDFCAGITACDANVVFSVSSSF